MSACEVEPMRFDYVHAAYLSCSLRLSLFLPLLFLPCNSTRPRSPFWLWHDCAVQILTSLPECPALRSNLSVACALLAPSVLFRCKSNHPPKAWQRICLLLQFSQPAAPHRGRTHAAATARQVTTQSTVKRRRPLKTIKSKTIRSIGQRIRKHVCSLTEGSAAVKCSRPSPLPVLLRLHSRWLAGRRS